MPRRGAARHLLEEGDRHPAELAGDPAVGGRVDVRVVPEDVAADAVGVVGHLAHRLAALAAHGARPGGQQPRAQGGRAQRPLRVEALVAEREHGHERAASCSLDSRGTSTWKDTALETTSVTSGTSPPAQARAKDVEPWQWTIALSVVRPGLAQDGGDQRRVVVARHVVERVVALGQVDRAAPVAQPDVVALRRRGRRRSSAASASRRRGSRARRCRAGGAPGPRSARPRRGCCGW